MSKRSFEIWVALLGILFTVAFAVIVVPPVLESGDVIGGFAAGFVNPYATGYSLDTILCGLILIVWILHERHSLGIRHGWICIILVVAPGVATAFAGYLLLRTRTASLDASSSAPN